MRIRLNEYKGRAADHGKRVSNEDVAVGTGISLRTVERISAGQMTEIRGEYIDAISTYFAELFDVDVSEIDLVVPDPVDLPLDLNIRPDRRGARVGQRTRRTNGHAAQRPENLSEFTALASEESLAREWLTPEEDEAWASL